MISDQSDSELQKSLAAAEATKIYNEIHQLRNHQFLITLAAITFFGVVQGVIFDDPKIDFTDIPNSVLNSKFKIIFGLHIVLIGLFLWLTNLSLLIAVLSVYLKKMNYSNWEMHF